MQTSLSNNFFSPDLTEAYFHQRQTQKAWMLSIQAFFDKSKDYRSPLTALLIILYKFTYGPAEILLPILFWRTELQCSSPEKFSRKLYFNDPYI